MNEIVKNKFFYQDGNLYRKYSSGGKKEGSICGWTTVCNGTKYKKININYKTYYLHQIIYLYHHGYIPEYIDHKDGNSLNNKIENLRSATQSQNCANQKLRTTNTSGIKGVVFNKKTKKWTASIMVKGKHISLGHFLKIEDAKKAYEIGSIKYFGEFARHE